MRQTLQLIGSGFMQALQELRANKLRTFLSLSGITIGIFCIIAVLTVVDSMKSNISKSVETLGSDVLYIGRWPWTAEEGREYQWWEYLRRRSMTLRELRAVEQQVQGAQYAVLNLRMDGQTVKAQDDELTGISLYAVSENFDHIQNVDIQDGRYLSAAELNGGTAAAVIGSAVYETLFPGGSSAIGKSISVKGRKFTVTGVMKRVGQDMAGFDFDNGVILPYTAITSLVDVSSLTFDPTLMVKAAPGISVTDLKYEVEGVLRTVRKIRPGELNDFSINQLSQVAAQLDIMFSMVNVVGIIIAAFSLFVGSFGIANIMFVTVRERRKIIGLKKAIGAPSSVILREFLTEAMTLCMIGGLIGILIVFGLSLGLTYGADFPVLLSFKNFFVGIMVSAVIGVLAGYVPARAAARLDPVAAIRSI